jgi:nucleoside-diphosphate-sugar epimerase
LTKKHQISIIGCGWLGMPLAKHFVEKGYVIKGSTTSSNKLSSMRVNGISPYLIQLNEIKIKGLISDFLEGSDTVIINIPPGLRKNPNKNHVEALRQLIQQIEKQHIKQVLYIGSTSVYKDQTHFPTITEKDSPNAKSESGKQLIAIEDLLKQNSNFKTTILRFSGLFDDNRHPGKFLSGKNNISNPEAPVNLIHKTDCIAIIFQLIENGIWNQTFVATNPYHPTKKNYYSKYCAAHNLPLPSFEISTPSEGKQIDASKLVQLLKYKFKTGI